MRLTYILLLGLLFAVGLVRAEDAEPASEQAAEEAVAVDTADRSGFTEEERAKVEVAGEKHEFQAEVNRLMDIIINSLYTNREIFLRELISNAADASDKIRFQSLQDAALLGEGDLADLDIRIQFDPEAKTITIRDKGVGMTKADLIKNLGVVAKSGTTEFLEAAKTSGDNLNLIGQFGVGFYSVYLIADRVTVASKHNTDKQHIWESTANSQFTVAEDPRGDTLGRGTSITLHLKEDAEEFLDQDKLSDIVKRYSQFVSFPIFLETSKEVSKEVPIEEEETDADEGDEAEGKTEEDKEGEDLEVSEEDEEEEEEKPKTKTVTETVTEWTRVNEAKAVWTRAPKEISDEDYESFFQTLTKNKFPDGHLDHIHFVAEGEITFKSLLYIPKKSDPAAQNDIFSLKKSGVHLYVRRVLISDEFEDFLPRYMNFVKGVVDSDDLPLNVSRENLAQSRVLKVMSKKLVRKVLDMLRKMADAGEEGAEDETEDKPEGEGEDGETEDKPKETNDKYMEFWAEFGKSIKFGVVDDRKNKNKLTKLLRYETSKSEGKEVSLQSYVDRMPEEQKYMYYVTGESMEKVKSSPFLEKVTEKGFEVVYMVDPLDEYVVGAMTEFEGVELQSVTKEGLKLGDEDRKSLQKLKTEYKPLTDWFKEVYGSKVEKVTVSNRLGKSPCVLVTGQYGYSANMQRIVQGSTLQATNQFMTAKKTLEINALHPIMQSLNSKIGEDDDESLTDLAHLLLDTAMLQSGFPITEIPTFNVRMSRVLSAGLGVDPDAKVDEDVEDEVKEDDEDGEEGEEEEEEEAVEEEEEEPKHEEL